MLCWDIQKKLLKLWGAWDVFCLCPWSRSEHSESESVAVGGNNLREQLRRLIISPIEILHHEQKYKVSILSVLLIEEIVLR